MCISCDAGMCRSYFHVTCAQKEGLLSEAAAEEVGGGGKLNGPTILPVKRIPAGQPKGGIPSIWNLELNLSIPQDIADPFFAYCKQHADRFDRKWKRKNYLALQSYCKVSLLEREKQLTPEAQVGWQIVEVMSRFFFWLRCICARRPGSQPACNNTAPKRSCPGTPDLKRGCRGRSCRDL